MGNQDGRYGIVTLNKSSQLVLEILKTTFKFTASVCAHARTHARTRVHTHTYKMPILKEQGGDHYVHYLSQGQGRSNL